MEYNEIKEQIKQKLPVEKEFGDSDNLLELGLSSIVIMRLSLSVECIQIDNGSVFTKHFTISREETLMMFQRVLEEHGIHYKLIRPF